MKGSSGLGSFSIHNSTSPQSNSFGCSPTELMLGERDKIEMSGFPGYVVLVSDVVIKRRRSGHNPELRTASIYGIVSYYTAMRMGRHANSSSFCDTESLENTKLPCGRAGGASGTNSSRKTSTGIGPTNFSHRSNVMSAWRSEAVLVGVDACENRRFTRSREKNWTEARADRDG